MKIETEILTLEKSITPLEVAIQAGGEVGGEAKIDLCIACILRELRMIGQENVQFSWNPRKR
jgi:hypothetical protein